MGSPRIADETVRILAADHRQASDVVAQQNLVTSLTRTMVRGSTLDSRITW